MPGTDIPSIIAPRWSASLLTPVGRGAVATIRVVGDLNQSNRIEPKSADRTGAASSFQANETSFDTLFQSVSGLSLSQLPTNKIAFGRWGITDTEELVVCRTAPDTLEIHCHGGDAAVQRVLNDLECAGCDLVDWRVQVAAQGDILDAESLDVLSRTSTLRTTAIVMEQSNGVLRRAFQQLNESLTAGNETRLRSQLNELLRWANFGLHLSTPWNVVLTGRPNVGKSSLINSLLGYQRAIVFDQPGTTRDVVTGNTAFEGWPVVLADTAGMRRDAPQLEAAGIALASEHLQKSDRQLVLIDVSQPPSIEDEELLSRWPDALVVAHKYDLTDRWRRQLPDQALKVSSVSGEGLIDLQKALVNRLVPHVPEPGTPIPLTRRQVDLLLTARDATTTAIRQQAIHRLLWDSVQMEGTRSEFG